MIRALFLLLSLISFKAFSQSPVTYQGVGIRMKQMWADSVARIPSDTTVNKTGIAVKGTTMYIGNGVRWTAVSGTAPAQFNPIAGTNMTLTGTYPNITFNSSGGGITSVTGWNVDNSDPTNPVILPITVDGTSVLGDGTPGDPLKVDFSTLGSWVTTGNTVGTTAAVLGTIDNKPLKFITNNEPAGFIGTEATANLAIGTYSLDDPTLTGIANTAIGRACLTNNTTGMGNTAIGATSGVDNTTGNYNVSIGWNANFTGSLTSNNNSIAIGRSANAISNQFALSDSIKTLKFRGLSKGVAGYVLKDTTGNGDFALQPEFGGGFLTVLGSSFSLNGKINVGSTAYAPASAALSVTSTTQGLLLPRMTKVQRDAISTPVAGLMIYQTDNTPGLRVYNGTNWMRFTEHLD